MCIEKQPEEKQPDRCCVRCFVPIPADRLEVLPGTELCCSCSHEVGGDQQLLVVMAGGDIIKVVLVRRPWARQSNN